MNGYCGISSLRHPFYEAEEGRIGEDCFGSMVVAGLESPVVKAFFTGKAKAAFTLATQQKRADKAVRDNAAPGGMFNWRAEVILGRDAEEIGRAHV